MKKHTVHVLLPFSALAFSVFAALSFPYLPAEIPMQFSMSGQVNWSLPTTYAIIAFSGICMAAVAYLIIRYKDESHYPVKDALVALLLPILFDIILIIALVTQ